MTRVGVDDGYRIWSRVYDRQPNALLALEERVVIPALPPLAGRVFVDVGAGTGRWTAHASARGARAFGIDLSAEMLAVAARKPRTSGGLLRACMRNIPLASDSADIALCSFALGHIPSPLPVLREMGRIARQVIVTDMHPLAIAAGWKRSFRAERDVFEIAQYPHTFDEIDGAAGAAGLSLAWRIEAFFDEPERSLFEAAGKLALFEQARAVPAVYAACWTRSG